MQCGVGSERGQITPGAYAAQSVAESFEQSRYFRAPAVAPVGMFELFRQPVGAVIAEINQERDGANQSDQQQHSRRARQFQQQGVAGADGPALLEKQQRATRQKSR